MTTSIGVARHGSPRRVSLEWLRDQYDAHSASWDATLDRLSFHRAYRQLLRGQVWEARNRPVSIVDIGIGSGATSIALASALIEQGIEVGQITGIDLSSQMLEQAAVNLASLGVPFSPICAEATELPLRSVSADYVICAHVVEHLPHPLRAMAEVVRIMAAGATCMYMMTRCAPLTVRIQKEWSIQCVRSKKLETVLTDFGLERIRCVSYPGSLTANLLSFCCIAEKPFAPDAAPLAREGEEHQ